MMYSIRNEIRIPQAAQHAQGAAPAPAATSVSVDVCQAAPAARPVPATPVLSRPLAKVSRGVLRNWTIPPQQSVTLEGKHALLFVKEGLCRLTDDKAGGPSTDLQVDSALTTSAASRVTLSNPSAVAPLQLLRVDVNPKKLPKHTGTDAPWNFAPPTVTEISNAPTLAAPDGSKIRLLPFAKSQAGGMITAELSPYCMSTPVRHKTVQEIWAVEKGGGAFHIRGPGNKPLRSIPLQVGTKFTIPTRADFQFESGAEGLKAAIFTLPNWPGDSEPEFPQGPFKPSALSADGYCISEK